MKTIIKSVFIIFAFVFILTACANRTNDPLPAASDISDKIVSDTDKTPSTTEPSSSSNVTTESKETTAPVTRKDRYPYGDTPVFGSEEYRELFSEAPDYCWYGFYSYNWEYVAPFSWGVYLPAIDHNDYPSIYQPYNIVKTLPEDTLYGLRVLVTIDVKEEFLKAIGWDPEEPFYREDFYAFASPEHKAKEVENLKAQGFIILDDRLNNYKSYFYSSTVDPEIESVHDDFITFFGEIFVAGTYEMIKNYTPSSENIVVVFGNEDLNYMTNPAGYPKNRYYAYYDLINTHQWSDYREYFGPGVNNIIPIG